jgi:hypothetical protein
MPDMRKGTFPVAALRLGTTPVNAVYRGSTIVWQESFEAIVEVVYEDFSDAPAGTNESWLPRAGWEADEWASGAPTTTIWRTYNDGSYKVLFGNAASQLHYDTGEEHHEVETYVKAGANTVFGVVAACHSSNPLVYVGWEPVLLPTENKLVLYFRDGTDHDEVTVWGAGLTAETWYTLKLEVDIPSGTAKGWMDGVLKAELALTPEQITALAGHTRAGPVNYAGSANYQWVSVRKHTVGPPPIPAITSLSPAVGPDDGGTFVTVTGTGFIGGPVVLVDGTPVTTTEVSATSLTFTTPAHAAGNVDVKVQGTYGESPGATFEYSTAAAPTVSSASPSPAEQTDTVTLTGTNFVTAKTWVQLGSEMIDNDDVTVASSTSLTFDVPADFPLGATTVTAHAPGGASSGLALTIQAAPPPTSGLIVWLDPFAESYANDDPVGSMTDQSPGGTYDATSALTARPTFKTAGIGGDPALSFDGVDDYLELPAGLSDWTTGLTVAFVMYPVLGSSANQKIFSLSNSLTGADDDIAIGFKQGGAEKVTVQTQNGSGTFAYYESSNMYPGASAYSPIVVAVTMPAAAAGTSVTSTIYGNGVVRGSGLVYVPPVVSRTYNWIGRSPWGTDVYFKGYLGDILVYNYGMTSGEVASLTTTLRAKYGI